MQITHTRRWFVNGQLAAVCQDLPLAHHEAADLRFMVSCRACLVQITPQESAMWTAQVLSCDHVCAITCGSGGCIQCLDLACSVCGPCVCAVICE